MFKDLVNFHGYSFQLLGNYFYCTVIGGSRVGALGDVVEQGRRARPQAEFGGQRFWHAKLAGVSPSSK